MPGLPRSVAACLFDLDGVLTQHPRSVAYVKTADVVATDLAELRDRP